MAVVVPKNVGGRDLKYQVCQKAADEEDCSEEDVIAVIDFKIKRNIAINSDGFNVVEGLFLPFSWQLSEPVDVVSAWTRINFHRW